MCAKRSPVRTRNTAVSSRRGNAFCVSGADGLGQVNSRLHHASLLTAIVFNRCDVLHPFLLYFRALVPLLSMFGDRWMIEQRNGTDWRLRKTTAQGVYWLEDIFHS